MRYELACKLRQVYAQGCRSMGSRDPDSLPKTWPDECDQGQFAGAFLVAHYRDFGKLRTN